MTPIANLPARFRELGRIRLGYQEDTGKTYSSGPKKGQPITKPVKLSTFRLTSPHGHLIAEAAAAFGGQPRPWDNDGQAEHELVTELADEFGVAYLPVVIPVTIPFFDQWYELWKGGGLERRCDGEQQVACDRACECPLDPAERSALADDGKACQVVTRLKVMLPALSDVGTWRVETNSYHAAVELKATADLLKLAGRHGNYIPAEVRLQEKESARRPGVPRRTFYVPAVTFNANLGQILTSLGAIDDAQVGAGAAGALPPADAPAPQRGVVDEVYDSVIARVKALSESDRSRLGSWCADQKPPIPIKGRRPSEWNQLAQHHIHAIAGWLDAHETRLAAEQAAADPPCTEDADVVEEVS